VQKHRPIGLAINHDHAKTAGAALTWACNALLDEAAAQIDVHGASCCPRDGGGQAGVRNPFAAGKSLYTFGLENPHGIVL